MRRSYDFFFFLSGTRSNSWVGMLVSILSRTWPSSSANASCRALLIFVPLCLSGLVMSVLLVLFGSGSASSSLLSSCLVSSAIYARCCSSAFRLSHCSRYHRNDSSRQSCVPIFRDSLQAASLFAAASTFALSPICNKYDFSNSACSECSSVCTQRPVFRVSIAVVNILYCSGSAVFVSYGFTCNTFLGRDAPGAFNGNGLGGRAIDPSTPAVEGGSAYIPGRIVLSRRGVTSGVCWMNNSRLSLDSYGSRKSSMLQAVPVRQERAVRNIALRENWGRDERSAVLCRRCEEPPCWWAPDP
mmetsp:Transcript_100/g.228  ORF Transcript_100/g.228 Transcript_100/m.228 type:complete len:300 (+) Transcript_100:1201-2100(+)